MRKLFVLILLALIASVFLAVQLARDPGYILVAYGNYTFETSLFALLVALLLVLAIVKLVLSLLGWLNPFRWGSSKRAKS
jgi:HemY protein